MAVVDAGSSGSRLFLYAYDTSNNNQLPQNIETIKSYKITPGLTNIPATKADVSKYLNKLMQGIEIKNLPVYYFATAGMRLEPQEKQERYYQLISDWFKTKPNLGLTEAKTISGKKEGIYGWLAINYQLGGLDKQSRQQYGVMDMGGASVQISFPVTDANQANTHMTINGEDTYLYVASFLGLGQNVVARQFLNDGACFPKNYPLSNGQLGEGDWAQCVDKIDRLTNDQNHVSNIHQYLSFAQSDMTWVAMGSMMYVKSEQPFDFPSESLTMVDYQVQAQQRVCQQDWYDIAAQYPQSDRLNLFCLYPAYYYSLIVDGYGFSPNQPIYDLPQNATSSWTLGVVIDSMLNDR